MPFIIHNYSHTSASWTYDVNDVIDLEWSKTIRCLCVKGVNTPWLKTDPGPGYDHDWLVNNSRILQTLPIVSIDLKKLFPNITSVSLQQIHIHTLTIPSKLKSLTVTDVHLIDCDNIPFSQLSLITLITCYGLWSRINTDHISSIGIYGDYIDNFVPCHNNSIIMTGCRIGRISKPTLLTELFMTECDCPYLDHIVNKRFQLTPENTHSFADGRVCNNYAFSPMHIRLQSIRKSNKQMDAENLTNTCVMLRNGSFSSSTNDPGVIQTAIALSSNYPRRSLEFIVYDRDM
jgi:hypothetical protein